jgi:hypothetical protein
MNHMKTQTRTMMHKTTPFPRRIQRRQGDHRGQQLPDEQQVGSWFHPGWRSPERLVGGNETPAAGF